MTTTDIAASREAIRRTLARRAGSDTDTAAMADALLSTWHDMTARVAPVIGARGVDVLFSYAVHLMAKRFSWLPVVTEHEDRATQLAGLREHLAARDAGEAMEASLTLLASFSELLAGLIGESLTDRLLGPVWVSPEPTSKQEPDP